MKMQLKQTDRSLDDAVRQLYYEAFPADERQPYWLLRRRALQGRADSWSLVEEDGRWVGLAYVLRQDDLAYLNYLAIDPRARGQGCGTRAIGALRAHYAGCRLFLALEPPDPTADNYRQRVKRHDFYARCGLTDLPHRAKELSVIYDLMGTGGPVAPEEYRALTSRWLGWPMRWLIDMRLVAQDPAPDVRRRKGAAQKNESK